MKFEERARATPCATVEGEGRHVIPKDHLPGVPGVDKNRRVLPYAGEGIQHARGGREGAPDVGVVMDELPCHSIDRALVDLRTPSSVGDDVGQMLLYPRKFKP